MDKENIQLLKTIGNYDLIIGIIGSMILFPFFRETSVIFIIGIGCSFINFIINSYANNMLVNIKKGIDILFIILSYILRIGFICSIAILFILRNEVNFFIFVGGYTAQFLSIILHGVKLKVKEGVWWSGGIKCSI